MRIYHEFLGNAFVEVNITLWSIVQRYHGHVNRLGDLDFVVEDRFHELAIVFQYRCGSLLFCICTVTVSFETNAIHCAIYFGATEDLLDLLSHGSFGRNVDSLAAERSSLLQTFLIQIGDDHNGRSQQMTRRSASQSNGTSSGHQHSCPGSDARANRPVVAGRENVRETGQISNLFHSLRFVWQLQEIEVGIRNHHKFGLTADPSSHVDVAVGTAGPGRVYI